MSYVTQKSNWIIASLKWNSFENWYNMISHNYSSSSHSISWLHQNWLTPCAFSTEFFVSINYLESVHRSGLSFQAPGLTKAGIFYILCKYCCIHSRNYIIGSFETSGSCNISLVDRILSLDNFNVFFCLLQF